MIDFSALKGLTIPEGVVAKIEKDGVVLWALQNNEPIVLKVKKITSNTYASETDYTDDHFILLDIYPKKNGTVKVTYGGITKTIKDDGTSETPNAQQVLFGTFNGVPDETETPESGTLTIEGGYSAFGAGSYAKTKSSTVYCDCITEIESFGSVSSIPDSAFRECSLTLTEIPVGIKHIGNYAFMKCTNVAVVEIPEGVETLGISCFRFENSPFEEPKNLHLPSTIQSIGGAAFAYDDGGLVGYVYIKDIYIDAQTPPVITTSSFGSNQTDDFTVHRVYVPKGCREIYEADEIWGSVASWMIFEQD